MVGRWTALLRPPVVPPIGAGNAVVARRPGVAVSAAVLSLVCAVLLLGSVGVLLAHVATTGPGSSTGRWSAALGAVATCALAGSGAVGALAVVRGTGRALLLTAAWLQAGVLGGTLAAVVADLAGGATTARTAVVVVTGCAVGLALTGATLLLGHHPQVSGWVTSAGAWRAVAGDPGATRARAVVLALLVPVAGLGLVTAVATWTAAHGAGGDRPAGVRLAPLPPPAAGDRGWSAEFAPDAAACAAGSMTACDALYWNSPVGDGYERYGATCGGRVAGGAAGGCVVLLGATLG